jgi:GNAT superfamily N-acetyltransferase
MARREIPGCAKLAADAFRGVRGGGDRKYFRAKLEKILGGYYGRFLGDASFVAKDARNDAIVGAILAAEFTPYRDPVVALVATHPARRSEGIGRALLNHCTEGLRKMGFDRCCANIDRRNSSSSGFFGACGFICDDSRTPEAARVLHLDHPE